MFFLMLAYFMGSIPVGLLLTKAAGLGDIRAIGSGNIGATNVLRTGNKKLALATLLLDVVKGVVAVWLVKFLAPAYVFWAALVVVLGHNYPLWLKFKGGKGVATTFGALLPLSPWLALALLGSWVAVFALTRISSLSALSAAVLAPGFCRLIEGAQDLERLMWVLSLLLIWRHRSNILRLMQGKEGASNLSSRKSHPKGQNTDGDHVKSASLDNTPTANA